MAGCSPAAGRSSCSRIVRIDGGVSAVHAEHLDVGSVIGRGLACQATHECLSPRPDTLRAAISRGRTGFVKQDQPTSSMILLPLSVFAGGVALWALLSSLHLFPESTFPS